MLWGLGLSVWDFRVLRFQVFRLMHPELNPRGDGQRSAALAGGERAQGLGIRLYCLGLWLEGWEP